MKTLNIKPIKNLSWLSISLPLVFLFSCIDETKDFQNSKNNLKEEFRALKNSANTVTMTEDLSVLRKCANEGHAMGKVELKFPEWGITEIYSFKVKSVHGRVFGYFDVEDFVDETGEGFDHCWGIISCVTFEEDGKTARLSGEVTGAVNYPDGDLPANHFARFTVVDNYKTPDQATALFTGQPQDLCDYHCTLGIPVDDESWWGTFREIEGKIMVKQKKSKEKHGE